jgi:hypothetical protein
MASTFRIRDSAIRRGRDYHYIITEAKNTVAVKPAELTKKLRRLQPKGLARKLRCSKSLHIVTISEDCKMAYTM